MTDAPVLLQTGIVGGLPGRALPYFFAAVAVASLMVCAIIILFFSM